MAPQVIRRIVGVIGVCCAIGGAAVVCAQAYPSKVIRVVITSAGSGPDTMMRLIGHKLTEAWGQQLVIDPRPGASGRIAAEYVARAAPDGYTLMVVTSMFAIGAALHEKLPYDAIRDFAPVILMASNPFVLVVHPSLPARSVKDLITLAKARSGQLHNGSSGAGSPGGLALQRLKSMAQIDIVNVPYKAGAQAVSDTTAGQLQMTFAVVTSVLPAVKQGRLRGLGVTSLKRTPLAPQIPTVAETVPGYEVIGWYGLVAPVNTPPEIISRLNGEIGKVLQTADFRDKLSSMGADVYGSTQQEFATYLAAQIEMNRKLIRESGAQPE